MEKANKFYVNGISTARFILLGLVTLNCPVASTTTQTGAPMHQVLLTQKGYVQFLRWELAVPEFSEFTFCLWLKSNDLTHPHPIFSYSKNERERLARSWIAPHGRSVHLEIGGRQVLATSTDILENRWYHVCLSWENQEGRYGVWVNGRLWTQGRSDETIGHTIPGGGDVVLGQEYTDVDKGLEDGIEGSVLGFNLLLASAFDTLDKDYVSEASYDTVQVSSASSYATVPLFARIPTTLTQRGVNYGPGMRPSTPRGRRYTGTVSLSATENGKRSIDSLLNSLNAEFFKLLRQPMGLQLVKLSYVRCEIGRGSPFIGGSLMLISWTRTPVKIFGGAVLKDANGDCGNF
ncbi:PREDICTED: uncharacterized protein LOC108552359 [Eufriesea mexicana]|uniref:uncharacterized protein LOC108552359 n=1 Tax=Eufriesea mexicana TaxID=516756 RepID=UPI00083C12A0|nr:PREDICTED: uncharacterized protein LOC108552359 [Eufriesea mexicana]